MVQGTRGGSDGDGPAIEARGLVKRYPGVLAVDGVDLAVRPGECLGLLGPNGAGKTTTVEMLEGLLRPDAGEVRLFGVAWGTGRDRWIRERIGVQLQESRFPEKLKVIELVRLFRSFYRDGKDEEEVLDLVGLRGKRDARSGNLSGGQRQRLSLACALVGDPRALFLDEPTTGLDPQARRRTWEIVEAFRERGGAVLLTTHSMEEAARLCDRVAILDRGRVLAEGPPAELVEALGADRVVLLEVEGEVTQDELAGLPAVRRATRRGETFVLAVGEIAPFLPALLERLGARGARLRRLAIHQPTLEDVFLELTGRSLRDDGDGAGRPAAREAGR